MMRLTNTLFTIKAGDDYASCDWRFALESLVQLVAPFAPHIAEELWHDLGNDDSVNLDHWPKYDEAKVATDVITYAVQVNGKVRGEVVVEPSADQETVIAAARVNPKVRVYLTSEPKKTIFVKGRLVSFVV